MLSAGWAWKSYYIMPLPTKWISTHPFPLQIGSLFEPKTNTDDCYIMFPAPSTSLISISEKFRIYGS